MMPDETAQAADDLRARACCLACRTIRFGETQLDEPYQRLAAASEGVLRLLTPVQGDRCGSPITTQRLVALSASAVSEERAYDDFRSGD